MSETTPESEIWRPVAEFTDIYEVSDCGGIRSRKHWTPYGTRGGFILKPRLNHDGYPMVRLYRGGKPASRLVHSLVAAAFVGPRPDGMVVRHLDGDPQNNWVGNLKYGTQAENNEDTRRHGRHYQANLTHCPQGHKYDEANTRYDRRGSRYCLACKRDKARKWHAGQREDPAVRERDSERRRERYKNRTPEERTADSERRRGEKARQRRKREAA